MGEETVHATAVLVGNRAALIRGPAGSGKTRLALALIDAAHTGALPFARLVADDRVRLSVAHGRLIAAAPDTIRGLAEVRGLGIRTLPYEARAVVGLVVDLAAADAARVAAEAGREIVILGVTLPRLAVAAGREPLPMVLGRATTLARA
ncbi:MAG TPA: HPr kinase/phosphatase C-terminal domain-containing protein [Xanthobacteraceae bacterium]|nr:HPr kinase/phosphatase C-terminal domain-containing protein [Xanthobacteraceae bacterium]